MFLERFQKLTHLYQLILLPFWLSVDEVRHSHTIIKRRFQMDSGIKYLINLGYLLAFPLKRSCCTTGKLRDKNSSFRAVFASISLSRFKSFASWPSIKQAIKLINSHFWTIKFAFSLMIAGTLTISVFLWGKDFKSSLMSLFMGLGKVCKIFSEESPAYFEKK